MSSALLLLSVWCLNLIHLLLISLPVGASLQPNFLGDLFFPWHLLEAWFHFRLLVYMVYHDHGSCGTTCC